MSDLLFIVTLLIWIPLIPLRLVIQAGIGLWRKIGEFHSLIFFIYWVVVDIFIFNFRDAPILSARFQSSPLLTTLGTILIVLSLGLAYWTSTTLGFTTLFLRPQLTPEKAKATLIISGPYAHCRHPFYFMEWILLTGLLLVTGSWIVLALLAAAVGMDPLVTQFEEKELLERFGQEYADYQKRVPRLLPTLAPLFSKGGS